MRFIHETFAFVRASTLVLAYRLANRPDKAFCAWEDFLALLDHYIDRDFERRRRSIS